MDTAQHDKVFVRTFILVLGVLFGITFAIMFVASLLTRSDAVDPLVLELMEDRLQPVGTVVTDPEALVKVAAKTEAEPQTAEQIVDGTCAGCHGSGVLDAPKIGDTAAWQTELDEHSVEELIASAIAGEGAMPPRGGDASLSDEQVAEAVKLMLERSGL